jgi:hypothetical protein
LFSTNPIAANEIQQKLRDGYKRISSLTKSAFKNLESSNADVVYKRIMLEINQAGGAKIYSEKSLKSLNPNIYSTVRWKWIWAINKTIHRNRLTKILKAVFMQ